MEVLSYLCSLWCSGSLICVGLPFQLGWELHVQPCLTWQVSIGTKLNGMPLHLGVHRSSAPIYTSWESANNVSFLTKEKAFKDDGQTLQQAKALSINKISHGDRARSHASAMMCIMPPAVERLLP